MTVRVNKDAFNVREKLSELDYGHVPYEKASPGSIIQVSCYKITSRTTFTSVNYVVAYTHNFHPRFNNSKLLHQFWAKSSMTTASGPAGQDFSITRDDLSADLFDSSWQNYWNQSDYTADFYPPCDFQFVDEARTTEPIEYRFKGRKYGGANSSSTWTIAPTNFGNGITDTTLQGSQGHWTIMEIKQ